MTKRICFLLPAATEIVCALDAADSLVGRSHECDWPQNVAHLPVLTALTRLPRVRRSTKRSKTSDGNPLFSLDEPLLRDLAHRSYSYAIRV